MSTAVMWFRNDLRLVDNAAWTAATRAERIVALVVLDDRLLEAAGEHRRSLWLASVESLAGDLDGELTIRFGDPARIVPEAAAEVDASSVTINEAIGAWGRRRDDEVEVVLASHGVELRRHWGTLVATPGSVLTGKGTLSRVFTPFYTRWIRTPLPDRPEPGQAEPVGLAGDGLPAFAEPVIAPGADAAEERLGNWLDRVDEYDETRDVPAVAGTSALSADLRMGTIGPRTVLDIVGTSTPGREAFVRQLAWRDWYAHLHLEHPDMARAAIRPEYDAIAWLDDDEGFGAWCAGQTGYPIVDAGMRQLAATGWMHNRVRMITASFLVKDLLVDWRRGERWFRRLLIDGEPSQNAGNWQWVAGTGPDAAPYFRIFNPVSQSRKFDAAGEYIRRWVPELAGLDNTVIHAPWEAAPLDLAAAGVVLGDTYPEPIIDHGVARDRTLAAYKTALGKS